MLDNIIVVLKRFRPFIKYNTTFYNGDIYNARHNTILTVQLFIKFNTFYHNDNARQYTVLTVRY
jgi:hypothetical protein